MTAKPRTPFSSASGKTGQSVTIQLLVRGIPIQAFVRRIDVCSERFADSGAEIFEGDHCDISDIPRATGFSQKMMSQALRAHPPSRHSEAAVSQLATYTEKYPRSSFAMNAPTGDVEILGARAQSLRKHRAALRGHPTKSKGKHCSPGGRDCRLYDDFGDARIGLGKNPKRSRQLSNPEPSFQPGL